MSDMRRREFITLLGARSSRMFTRLTVYTSCQKRRFTSCGAAGPKPVELVRSVAVGSE
jgi:hypothetical protein